MRSQFLLLTLLLASIALPLSGCTEIELVSHAAKTIGHSKSQGTFKVGNPYKVSGKWYKPTENYTLVETGIASWYGPNFHGKPTANGEIFNQNELTAAHRTLHLPAIVRVTNLENGRSIIVRVNDRGPFKRGRVIDLSKRAAELLAYKNKGTAKVRIQVLEKESRAIAEIAKRGHSTKGTEIAMNRTGTLPQIHAQQPSPILRQQTLASEPIPHPIQRASLKPVERTDLGTLTPLTRQAQSGNFYPKQIVKTIPVPKTGIYVQAASFSSQENALRYARKLNTIGKTKVISKIVNGHQMHRVRFGPLRDVADADSILAKLIDNGQGNGLIIVE